MKTKKGKLKKRKVVFSKGPIHLVDCEVQMPNGKVLSRQLIEHPGAVVVIPKIRKNKYILIRQYRYAARSWIWEFPAGGIEKGETVIGAAKRELCEETSLKPKRVKRLFDFFPTPGISEEIMYLCLAEDLHPGFAEKDEDEDIEVYEFSLSEIEKMIKSKKIVDGKTLLGFYFLKQFKGR